ncbi:long-chain fatty acid transport protein 2-like [Amphiura filiformis]|uniref:long-chain fatty acid transport protein 2-like n=1 Tax=Amphiura filiformis TaxID=82378 RepID=UPI003B20FCCA
MTDRHIKMVDLLTIMGAIVIGFVILAVFLYFKYPTLSDDLSYFKKLARIGVWLGYTVVMRRTILDVFEKWVYKQPNKPCILFGDETHTYLDVDKQANKLAHYLKNSNLLKIKDVACIFMYNEPAYAYSWLAFTKLGATTSLINVNLRGRSLLHCITASKAAVIMCGKDQALVDALSEIEEDLHNQDIKVLVYGKRDQKVPDGMVNVESHLRNASVQPLSSDFRAAIKKGVKAGHSAFYIFTSGTTGLPKPARMSHRRLLLASQIQSLFDMDSSDIIYIPLPMYHSAGMCIGLVNVLRAGATAALRPKFSASHFWEDVRKYRANVIQYIGETCRYLLAQPKRDDDGQYPVPIKLALGNGMRSDLWIQFKNRFNIQRIGEFYGATEANFMIFNLDGKVGAVGRYSPFVKAISGNIQILKCDVVTAEPERDASGMCIPQPLGVPGLMALRVDLVAPVEGYVASKKVNEKKLIHDVKRKGDTYFNTGDLLMVDEEFYIYFNDRIGDTFRWKGENVSTTEVALVVEEFPQISESNVYGVEVPGCEGRCGMVAVVLSCDHSAFDWPKFYKHVTNYLPGYACPKFLRIRQHMMVTSTFKHMKVELVKEGFNPSQIADTLYIMDAPNKTYMPLDAGVYQHVRDGKIKL